MLQSDAVRMLQHYAHLIRYHPDIRIHLQPIIIMISSRYQKEESGINFNCGERTECRQSGVEVSKVRYCYSVFGRGESCFSKKLSTMNCIFYFLLTFCFIKVSDGVMCYWCSGVGDDRECEQHPYAVQTGPVFLNCRAHFCLSVKVIDADSGTVKSFARLCDNVPRDNVCIQDSKLLTCYESCTDDLCNNGNPDPEFLPITNYASEASKHSKGNKTNKITNGGLKGNIFEQYGISKTGRSSSLMKNKEHLSAMETARKRLLSNAVRGSKDDHSLPRSPERQMRLPLSRKKPQIVTEATLNTTKVSVQYITDTKYRATLKPSLTPVANGSRVTTLSPTSTKISGLTSQMTPITTLAIAESTNSLQPSVSQFDEIKQTTISDFPFASSPKMAKVNDIHYKASTSEDSGKNSATFNPNEYTFGASNPSGSSRGLTLKPSWIRKSTPKRITVRMTTFKADVSSKMIREKITKTTIRTPKKVEITQIIKPQTNEKLTKELNLKHPLKSLIMPNNVANLEKPVTAIDANSYAELHGLEETEGPENTFAFNSHPRNPNLPKHKHRIGHSKKIESSNGIVIWPMKESTREEDISNSIFSEDKEEAIIEPYRGNSTSLKPNGDDESKTPDNNKKTNNINDSANQDDDKLTPITPITTGATSKTSTINTVSLPIETSKDNNLSDHIKTVLNRKTPIKISLKGKLKNISNKINTTTSSSSLGKSTRLYASKLAEVWNEEKTTVIVDKHDDLPIPPEYSSFFEDDELIEYPVFENEVSSFKDTTEDQLHVASYQDESDSSSKRPSIALLFVIHVLTLLCLYFLS
ncbi:hypothetical protein LOTGIDRAFT_157014 [Lottia gigantea]|uniref:UPAR/Ly6 domain-containing protein n=1 Tax=Lottia gigantea TaxID=225164 RepID=V4AZA4_LOTGI|nr:hypothetical protein LOTGIDRAFT_157014 [Lottia gigantea]ESP03053.1 hypothetical protein LOTGIDRAFT_157014 [Lottia gigantea]